MKTNRLEHFDPAELDILQEALCQYRSYLRGRMNYRGDLQSIKKQMQRTNDLLADVRSAWDKVKEDWKEKCQ